MSYYLKKKFKMKRIRRIYDDMRPFERQHWRRRLDRHWKSYALPCDYSLSPSWWNRLHSIKPSRRKGNNLLSRIALNNVDDYFDWPDYRKPNIYYW